MVAALLGFLVGVVPADEVQVQSLLESTALAMRAPTCSEVRRTLWPALHRKYPRAELATCAATNRLPGALFTARLRADAFEHTGCVAALVWRRAGHCQCQVLQFVDTFDGSPKSWFVFGGEAWLERGRLVRCGDANGGGNWDEPVAEVFTYTAGRWRLRARRLGDLMTGYPGTRFARAGGKVDPRQVIATTREYPKNISQPHAGPLLQYRATWQVRGVSITVAKPYRTATPLAALDDLTGLVRAGDRSAFDRRTPASDRTALWALLAKPYTVNCKHSVEEDDASDLFARPEEANSEQETALHFRRTRNGWRIARVDHESSD